MTRHPGTPPPRLALDFTWDPAATMDKVMLPPLQTRRPRNSWFSSCWLLDPQLCCYSSGPCNYFFLGHWILGTSGSCWVYASWVKVIQLLLQTLWSPYPWWLAHRPSNDSQIEATIARVLLPHLQTPGCPPPCYGLQEPHSDSQSDVTLARVMPHRPELHYPSWGHQDPSHPGGGLQDLPVSCGPVRTQATPATKARTTSTSTTACRMRPGMSHIVRQHVRRLYPQMRN